MFKVISSKSLPLKDARKQRVIVRLPADENEPDAFSEEKAWGTWHRKLISDLADLLPALAKEHGLVLEGSHTIEKESSKNYGLTFETGPAFVDWLVKCGGGVYLPGFILPCEGKFDVEVVVEGSISVPRSAIILPDKVRKMWVAYKSTPALAAEGKTLEPREEICADKRFSRCKYLLLAEYRYSAKEVYYPEAAEKAEPVAVTVASVEAKKKVVIKK